MTYANTAKWGEWPRIASSVRASEYERHSQIQHSSSYTSDHRWQAKSALWNLFEECHLENWDGYGAKGITPETFEIGLDFLDKLPGFVINPEVAADPDGDISFEWFLRIDIVLTISVSSKRKIAYAGIFGQDKPHGIENFGLEIPSIILTYLSRYFGNVIDLAQG